ncbi:hypothetical protein CANCADRAFT_121299 [Tortispora caseinolytica NRRL Y-17796]|uniref:Importin N-terminal domain-containing protein n=1 Tax=Tortispora caseinolytica NRRL Y-17796 TaxID=767744 RepID=A0A1E4THG4_9ASCO|nr:hypothetical protein CANCADRAFT_121299 [Tortispora caseinolytica NRRL Y-17796]
MDINALHSCFAATLSPDPNIRKKAEDDLREAERAPGLLNACMNIVFEEQASSVHKAAAIYMKNVLHKALTDEYVEKASGTRISTEEKELFKKQVIEALIKVTNPQIHRQIVRMLNILITFEYPSLWPELPDIIISLIRSHDIAHIRAGAACLAEFGRAYTWRSGNQRRSAEVVITGCFDNALAICNLILDQNQTEHWNIIRDILKAYKFIVIYELPELLQKDESMIPWVTLFLKITAYPIPQEVMDLSEDNRVGTELAKCKKRTAFILCRIFERYGAPSLLSQYQSDYKSFAKHFLAGFAPQIIETYLREIEGWVNKSVWIPPKCMYYIVRFLEVAACESSSWKLLQPHYEGILARVIYPLLCPDDDDIEIFETNPEEYINRRVEIFEDSPTLDIAASRFLKTAFSKRRRSTFQSTVQFIDLTVTEADSMEESDEKYRRKDGALRMVSAISLEILKKGNPLLPGMENFLVSHVFDEFRSEFGILRARACELVRIFCRIEFHDMNNLIVAYNNVLQCLFDPEIVVQIDACNALERLMNYPEIIEALKPKVPEVMQQILKVSHELEMDSLGLTMDKFVETFAADLAPFANSLTSQLVDQYLELIEAVSTNSNAEPGVLNDTDGDDYFDHDKLGAAMSLLNTTSTFFLSLENSPDLVASLLGIVYPAISRSFELCLIEIYTEVIDLMTYAIYSIKRIPPLMWNLFDKCLVALMNDGGIDFYAEFCNLFILYLMHGSDDIKSNPELLDKFVGIVNFGFQDEIQNEVVLEDKIMGLVVAQTMMLLIPSSLLDRYIPDLVEKTMVLLEKDEAKRNKSQRQSIPIIEVILACLCCDMELTLRVLDSKPDRLSFCLQLIIQHRPQFSRVYDKKLYCTALLNVLSNTAELPPILSGHMNSMLFQQGILKCLESLPEAEANLKKMKDEMLTSDYYVTNEDDLAEDIWDDVEDEDEEGSRKEGALDPSGAEGIESQVAAGSEEYMNFLSSEVSRITGESADPLVDILDDDDDDAILQDNPHDETPLDNQNTYALFTNAMAVIESQFPERYSEILWNLSAEQGEVIKGIVARANASPV